MKDHELKKQSGETDLQYIERLILTKVNSTDLCRIFLADEYLNRNQIQERLEECNKRIEMYESILGKEGYIPPKKENKK